MRRAVIFQASVVSAAVAFIYAIEGKQTRRAQDEAKRDAAVEARRAREREAEREREERRRLEAIEEEKEIRELRRRAVPKANEMPEWYAQAPKRSHDAKT